MKYTYIPTGIKRELMRFGMGYDRKEEDRWPFILVIKLFNFINTYFFKIHLILSSHYAHTFLIVSFHIRSLCFESIPLHHVYIICTSHFSILKRVPRFEESSIFTCPLNGFHSGLTPSDSSY